MRLCYPSACFLQSLSQFRVYALTKANKYVLVGFSSLVVSSLATGLWLVSVPSATGNARIWYSLFASNLSAQPYRCPRSPSIRSGRVSSLPPSLPSGPIGYRSRSLVPIGDDFTAIQESHILTDLITSVSVVVFALKLKANHGQSRMTRLMRNILQDSVLYFFVMAGFHIAMVFFTFFARVITFILFPKGC